MRDRFIVASCASITAGALLAAACTGSDPAPLAAVGTTPGDGGAEAATAVEGVAIVGDVTDEYARAVAGATVRVAGTTTTTSATGHFELANVAPVYDLDVLAPSKANGKAISSFRGLTTRTPQAIVEGVYVVRSAPIMGTLGTTAMFSGDAHLAIANVDRTTGLALDRIVLDPANTWTGAATWLGGPATDAAIWALRYSTPTGDGPTGAPTSFTGYKVLPHTLADTIASGTGSTSLFPATTATISGKLSALPRPAASALVSIALKSSGDRFGLPLDVNYLPTQAFSVKTAAAPGLTVNVVAQAGGNDGAFADTHRVWKANLASDAAQVSLVFGSAARSASPENAAIGIAAGSTFVWTDGSPVGVYRLEIRCGSDKEEYVAHVYTTTARAVPPDASALGAAWPKGASCGWEVVLFQTITTVDAVTATASTLTELTQTNGPVDGAYVRSSGYTFETAR